jgi:PhzF family phenazine biosynthesis protein
MTSYQFKQVDVFTARPFYGNPVAVVLNASGLGAEDMQRIASWTNLSETTFVLPATVAGADYRLRIFTPKQELPFAGHPTIGSAHAILESERVQPVAGRLVQECGAGLLDLRVAGSGAERRIFVKAPQPTVQSVDAFLHAAVNAALGAPAVADASPLLVNVGPVWMVVDVGHADTVNNLRPDFAAISRISEQLHIAGITVFGRTFTAEPALCVRSFAPACGVPEDPVCGSGNASVAAFLAHAGMIDTVGYHYVASQGRALGRDGRVWVHVNKVDLSVEIGGASVTCIDGTLRK